MKNKKIFIFILCITMICGYSYRVYAVNSRYEEIKYEQIEMKEAFDYNGLTCKITDKTIIDGKSEDEKIIWFLMRVDNNTKEDIKFSLLSFKLDWNHDSMFLSTDDYLDMNRNIPSYNIILSSGSTVFIKLPYQIFERNMPGESWENMENVESELVFQLYPVKRYIKVEPML